MVFFFYSGIPEQMVWKRLFMSTLYVYYLNELFNNLLHIDLNFTRRSHNGRAKSCGGGGRREGNPSVGYLYLSVRACFRFYQTTKTERISEYIGEIWRNSEKMMVRNNNNNNNKVCLFPKRKGKHALYQLQFMRCHEILHCIE